ncbi:hypothetical protein L6164_018268 [Bauhinia variegata]|uniref:Uncharacterized protein n=1 Tax=Bauhinia variegata TaxID=167791 RepID=A0ACB9NAS3_BAUVA|nr:hypothetical protein L6164_018268 [Bauhinia variegata]
MEHLVNMHRHLLDKELSFSPATNKTRESFMVNVNFDTNMVMALTALLCALIFALGMNSILRCARRCGHRFPTETQLQTTSRLSSTGLKKRDLSQIPVVVYGFAVDIPATECPICLAEFEKGDKVRLLPQCNHGFHVWCIDKWLVSHSSCPNCRLSLLEQSTSTNSSASHEVAGNRAVGDGSGRQDNVVVVADQAS